MADEFSKLPELAAVTLTEYIRQPKIGASKLLKAFAGKERFDEEDEVQAMSAVSEYDPDLRKIHELAKATYGGGGIKKSALHWCTEVLQKAGDIELGRDEPAVALRAVIIDYRAKAQAKDTVKWAHNYLCASLLCIPGLTASQAADTLEQLVPMGSGQTRSAEATALKHLARSASKAGVSAARQLLASGVTARAQVSKCNSQLQQLQSAASSLEAELATIKEDFQRARNELARVTDESRMKVDMAENSRRDQAVRSDSLKLELEKIRGRLTAFLSSNLAKQLEVATEALSTDDPRLDVAREYVSRVRRMVEEELQWLKSLA